MQACCKDVVLALIDEDRPKCYLCHEGFESIEKLKEHQNSAHRGFFEYHEKEPRREPAPGDINVF